MSLSLILKIEKIVLFDLSFINYELEGIHKSKINSREVNIIDTIDIAKKLFPGQSVSLDALCKRYGVDNSSRDFHGALLDARILGDVYLAMTGGQTSFNLAKENINKKNDNHEKKYTGKFLVQKASDEELREHEELCNKIDKVSNGRCIWNIPKI